MMDDILVFFAALLDWGVTDVYRFCVSDPVA